jgi:folylpolyglutamate synthase
MSNLFPRHQIWKHTSRYLSTEASRDYGAAINALNSLQSNHATVAKIRKYGRDDQSAAIPEMVEFAERAGLVVSDLDGLNAIHIAGTKGKGSTSAFISSILATHCKGEQIGLFTSPHLRFVRERIQIDNSPISEDMFAKYFFEVWDKFSSTADGTKPMYFRYLTIMAFHLFLKEHLHSSVIECGIGGEYDSTNIIGSPSVTAITALGIDHEALLGKTLPEIAWHKSGIFKSGAVALTSPQPESAMKVLRDRADEKGVELHVISRHPQIDSGEIRLGLSADYQKSNASLAAAAASAHLRRMGFDDVPDLLSDPTAHLPLSFIKGLENTQWPGRSDIRDDASGKLTWFLDGAHTIESVSLAAQWFSGQVKERKTTRRILIFNQQSRDARALLKTLYEGIGTQLQDVPFDEAIFCTNRTNKDTGYKPDLLSLNNSPKEVQDLSVQTDLAELWKELSPRGTGIVASSVEEAVETARGLAQGTNEDKGLVLVCGSLHLVGGVIDVLEDN